MRSRDEDRIILANLQSDLRIGPKTLHILLQSGLDSYLKHERLINNFNFTKPVRDALRQTKNNFDKDILRTLGKSGIKYLAIFDPEYPELLKKINTPPVGLYVRGDLPVGPYVSIVGNRKISTYGQRVTVDLATKLAAEGIVIASGMALGVDGMAHRASIEAGGKTVAVLAGGADRLYPASHYNLGLSIVNNGAVVSEFPPGTQSLRHHFPIRNRVIAGLSLGTIVIEAEEKSGSLITARSALEENRDVFAVPGSIYSAGSAGPHFLIKMGAKLVHRVEDILLELGLEKSKTQKRARESIADSKEEALILKLLTTEPISFEVLADQIDLDPAAISSTLTLMEMKGRVRNLGNNQFVLVG
ncbi:DNA-processing protein DprA [Candidatus Berkelbacteria bacterium]|nr:DNA-processing protein DprA [Candidatus Berkelbacteria bacterium]